MSSRIPLPASAGSVSRAAGDVNHAWAASACKGPLMLPRKPGPVDARPVPLKLAHALRIHVVQRVIDARLALPSRLVACEGVTLRGAYNFQDLRSAFNRNVHAPDRLLQTLNMHLTHCYAEGVLLTSHAGSTSPQQG